METACFSKSVELLFFLFRFAQLFALIYDWFILQLPGSQLPADHLIYEPIHAEGIWTGESFPILSQYGESKKSKPYFISVLKIPVLKYALLLNGLAKLRFLNCFELVPPRPIPKKSPEKKGLGKKCLMCVHLWEGSLKWRLYVPKKCPGKVSPKVP